MGLFSVDLYLNLICIFLISVVFNLHILGYTKFSILPLCGVGIFINKPILNRSSLNMRNKQFSMYVYVCCLNFTMNGLLFQLSLKGKVSLLHR